MSSPLKKYPVTISIRLDILLVFLFLFLILLFSLIYYVYELNTQLRVLAELSSLYENEMGMLREELIKCKNERVLQESHLRTVQTSNAILNAEITPRVSRDITWYIAPTQVVFCMLVALVFYKKILRDS
jgi:hypothetical protein